MNDLVPWLQDAVAAAFVVLGLVTAISWLRSRDRSMGFLALAIILLSAVSGLGRLQAHLPFTVPLLGTLNLLGFAGSGYALLLYRDSLIPLPRRWHAVAIASLAAASVFLIVAQALSVGRTASTIIAVVWVLIWCACVGEPIARFWLVARNLPAVQAWRLRSLSIGFGGLVGILLFAISIGFLVREPIIQVIFELAALAIVPLLYASFAPVRFMPSAIKHASTLTGASLRTYLAMSALVRKMNSSELKERTASSWRLIPCSAASPVGERPRWHAVGSCSAFAIRMWNRIPAVTWS